MKITRIAVERWEEYKNLRLEAVQNNPPAFLSYPDETENASETKWQSYLEAALEDESTSRTYFAENDEGNLIGVVGGFFDSRRKVKHVGNIVSFYVSPEYRGKGIGSQLIEKIEDWLKSKNFISKLKLSVYEGNPAINLYKRMGYKEVGKLEKEVHVDNEFFNEIIMEKIL